MAHALRLITANVNGIRAAERRGGLRWLRDADADVLCLQEIRATDAQLKATLDAAGFGDWVVAFSPGTRAGHAGVAVVSRLPAVARRSRLPAPLAGTGRWVEADVVTALGTDLAPTGTRVE